MTTVENICQLMNQWCPTRLAEEWDNVGLLVGDEKAPVKKLMTCLTVTPDSVKEAVDRSVDMIVSHHPMPFQPLKKITNHSTVGKMMLELIRNSIAVYSPHTGFDSASKGINQSIVELLQLENARPINLFEDDESGLGSGRMGEYDRPRKLREVAMQLKAAFSLSGVHFVGSENANARVIGVACGSGGSFLGSAIRKGCDTLVTGETNFHTCLEAQAQGVSLVLLGHFGSERFAVEKLAESLAQELPEVECWACQGESDPVNWL